MFEGPEDEIKAKFSEVEADEQAKRDNKISGKANLKSGDALTDAEISALFGD